MKKVLIVVLTIGLLSSIASCSKDFYSGGVILEGTTVKYIVDVSEKTLTVKTEGNKPDAPIYVELEQLIDDKSEMVGFDSITDVPCEKPFLLEKAGIYSLFLKKNGKEMGVGMFEI